MTDPENRLEADDEATGEAPTAVDALTAGAPGPAAATIEASPEPAGGTATTVETATVAETDAAAAAPVRRVKGAAKPHPARRPLSPYAVIETGGKQYRVSVGETLAVERLTADAGTDLTIDRVLLVGGDGATRVGTPTVGGASVTARVEDHYRGEKIVVFKYKAKKRYRRRTGHRQSLTRLTITGINV